MTQMIDVTILGAGPYGLAAGAHLRQVAGLEVQVFGDPMEFWKAQMPAGMFLRSPWSASHISDPASQFTLGNYRSLLGREISAPIPIDDFVGYGLWFQQNTMPGIMRQKVTNIQRDSSGFQLTLDTGTRCSARRLVIAGGIKPFARRPEQFAGQFPQFVTHSSDQRDVNQFRGKRVAVIGAGQSALESAALILKLAPRSKCLSENPIFTGWAGGQSFKN